MPGLFNNKLPHPTSPAPSWKPQFWQQAAHWDPSHRDLHSPPFQSPAEVTSRSCQGTLRVCHWALLPTSLHRCSPRKQESRVRNGVSTLQGALTPFLERWRSFPWGCYQWLLRLNQHKPQSQMGEQKLKCARAVRWDSKPSVAFGCLKINKIFCFSLKDRRICIFFILILLK